MARAKHTVRTDARRRYRAELAAQRAAVEGEEEVEATPARRDAAKSPTSAPASGVARPGMTNALRASFRPLDLRGDLRFFPRIVTHWALLAAIGASVVATAVFILSTNELGASLDFSLSDPMAGKSIGSVSNLSYLAVSLLVAPPPAAGAFLVGFTAPRASWLGGLVYGVAAAACYAAIVLTPAGRLLIAGNSPDVYVVNGAVVAPVGALLFAAAAAWYKRFLNLANPNRGRPQPKGNGKQKARPSAAKAGNRAR